MDWGAQLAARLKPGDVIALSGELGAGKTCLVKGIAHGLGIAQDVTSPTFTLIHEYQGGRLPLYHLDLYRLRHLAEAEAIGVDEYLAGNGVTVVEWAERIDHILPAHTQRIRLTIRSETQRDIELTSP
jgi:tRNA threonylcarbamoyladenosine biosynthesis protein TsaE